MKFFLISERTCAVKVNGLYLGLIDGFERQIEAELSDALFFEVIPADAAFLPVCFTLDHEALRRAPNGVKVYRFSEGAALYFDGFFHADATPALLAQEKQDGVLVTLLRQGSLTLSVETEEHFALLALPDTFGSAKPSFWGNLICLDGEGAFGLFDRMGKTLFLGKALSVHKEEQLSVRVPLFDGLGRFATSQFDKDGTLLDYTLSSATDPNADLILFACAESMRIGGDYTCFLHESLRPRAADLKGFFGAFCMTVPRKGGVGLVYPAGERLFDVTFFTAELQDGLLSNITECEPPAPP